MSGFDYGGRRVDFEKAEMTKIKVLYRPGLTLIGLISLSFVHTCSQLGFKPISSLKVYYNLKHASFVYPEDEFIQGSTVAFAALLDRMLHLRVV